jgi:hypothetical protein
MEPLVRLALAEGIHGEEGWNEFNDKMGTVIVDYCESICPTCNRGPEGMEGREK